MYVAITAQPHIQSFQRSYKMSNINYEKYNTSMGEEYIKKTDADGNVFYIPSDPTNSDYQAYLKSLDEAATL